MTYLTKKINEDLNHEQRNFSFGSQEYMELELKSMASSIFTYENGLINKEHRYLKKYKEYFGEELFNEIVDDFSEYLTKNYEIVTNVGSDNEGVIYNGLVKKRVVKICCNCKTFHYVDDKKCGECHGSTFEDTHRDNLSRIAWDIDPDDNQYGRQIGNYVFEFKDNTIYLKTIDLRHYSNERLEKEVAPYYGSMEKLKENYGESWKWVTAECIFGNLSR